ncbi:hypothetical protein ACFWVP_19650 [Streptomyces sp. NPDC058637]
MFAYAETEEIRLRIEGAEAQVRQLKANWDSCSVVCCWRCTPWMSWVPRR